MPDIRKIDIDLIQTDVDQIQTRMGLDEKRVEILCEKYKEQGAEAFPLPIVFQDADGVYRLASGHYRLAAIRKALGPEDPHVVQVEVREGNIDEAAFFAAGANSEHGTQLTWAEMRRLVRRLLRHPKWGEIGDREIARHVGASHTYVSNIHQELDEEDASVNGLHIPSTRKVKTRRGEKEFTTTIDKTRRSRSKKAKTKTTATPPDSPEVPQDSPGIDTDAEHTTEIGDGSGPVSAPAITPAKISGNHLDASSHSLSATEEDDLAKAWLAASYAERRDFLPWLVTRSVTELGVDSNPDGIASIGEMMVEISKNP
jgi:hypothetical protein